jgi:hypothetical protein
MRIIKLQNTVQFCVVVHSRWKSLYLCHKLQVRRRPINYQHVQFCIYVVGNSAKSHDKHRQVKEDMNETARMTKIVEELEDWKLQQKLLFSSEVRC